MVSVHRCGIDGQTQSDLDYSMRVTVRLFPVYSVVVYRCGAGEFLPLIRGCNKKYTIETESVQLKLGFYNYQFCMAVNLNIGKDVMVVRERLGYKNGFTLLEMLVVLTLISLLAGLVGPRLFTKVDASKVKATNTQIKMLKAALETYRLDVGSFPSPQEGLSALYHMPQDSPISGRWHGPYLDEDVPLDPWGNPYQYSVPGADGQPFALYSMGADGQLGGEGFASDLGYLPK